MSRTYINALVVTNDGDTAVLKTQNGPTQEVTFRRDEESVPDFLQMFPVQDVVQLFHPEDESSSEEEEDCISNWITVKVLTNDGEEALLEFPGGDQVGFHRADDELQSDFIEAWPTGDTVEFKIVGVQHGGMS
jgi:hypothetical protein